MDVHVIGAGVIGLTTAVTLAEHGHRVLVRTAEPPALTTTTRLNTSAQPHAIAQHEPGQAVEPLAAVHLHSDDYPRSRALPALSTAPPVSAGRFPRLSNCGAVCASPSARTDNIEW